MQCIGVFLQGSIRHGPPPNPSQLQQAFDEMPSDNAVSR